MEALQSVLCAVAKAICGQDAGFAAFPDADDQHERLPAIEESHDTEPTTRAPMASTGPAPASAAESTSSASSSSIQPQQQAPEQLNLNQRRRHAQQQQQQRDQLEQPRQQEQPRLQVQPRVQEQTQQQDRPPQRQHPRQQQGAARAPPHLPLLEPEHRQPQPIGQLTRVNIMPDDEHTVREIMNGIPIPTAHYMLPLTAPDGRQAMVALPGDLAAWLPTSALAEDSPLGLDGLEGFDRDEPAVPYVPTSPYYVPRGGTAEQHLPWLYDDRTGWAWPMMPLSDFRDGMLPWSNLRGAHWLAGPPHPADVFPEDDTRGPQWALPSEERLSSRRRKAAEAYPSRVKRFLDGLDTVDADLLLRMRKLGMGQIGSDASGGPGCVICLEQFGEEDAEWLADTPSQDQQVVVSPCDAFHTFHRGCLRQTLEMGRSWRSWACPSCRVKLRDSEGRKMQEREQAEGVGQAASYGLGGLGATATERMTAAMAAAATRSASTGKTSAPTVPRAGPTSLREQVRRREKERGYVCDHEGCHPRYDERPPTPPLEDEDPHARLSAQVDRRFITLKPCGHRVHRECLISGLSIEDRHALESSFEEDEGALDDDDSNARAGRTRRSVASEQLGQLDQRHGYRDSPTVHELGRWVQCCVDGKDAWAMIPVVKKGKPTAGEQEADEVSGNSEQRRLDKGKGKAKA